MKIIEFDPTYLKDNGLVAIYNKSVLSGKNLDFTLDESGVIVLPPDSVGGNHKHLRREAFYSLGDLRVYWIDKKGKKISQSMAPMKNKYKLFVVEPYESHVIKNISNKDQILVEYASVQQSNVEPVKII
jgi:hypothetical protein